MDKTLARIAVLHPDFGVWATSPDGGRIPELVAKFRPLCDPVLDCIGNHAYIPYNNVIDSMESYSKEFPDLLFQVALFCDTDERLLVYLLKDGVAVTLMDESNEDRAMPGCCLRLLKYAADSYEMLNELTHYVVAQYWNVLPVNVKMSVSDFRHYAATASSGQYLLEHSVAANEPAAFAEEWAVFEAVAERPASSTEMPKAACSTHTSEISARAPPSRTLRVYCRVCDAPLADAADYATDTERRIDSVVRTCGSARNLHALISEDRLRTFECLSCGAASTTYLDSAVPTSGAKLTNADGAPGRVLRPGSA